MVIPRFGFPADPAQWGALALGVAALAWGSRAIAFARRHERAAVAVLALAAALLSWGYTRAYLRGGPRIIDATSYYLEARGLAEGHVSWPTGEPETSVLGRFLVRSEDPAGARAAVLFPPGYPLLLALGFLIGAPLAVGPLLAALLVLATYALAREVVRDSPGAPFGSGAPLGPGAPSGSGAPPGSPDLAAVPLLAAALSVVCGALRYHTADTMSHGLAALCFTCAIAFLLAARRRLRLPARSPARAGVRSPIVPAALAGLFAGWLFATRPASALAWGATALLVLASSPAPASAARSWRDEARMGIAIALGALPFLIVFAAHQRLATGHLFESSHAASYAANDGPPGCFRYGFGEGIGCYGEHGDFVRANLPHGFGLVAAVKTTARRLWMHLVDPANLEPLAVLVLLSAWLARPSGAARVLGFAVIAQVAAYAPFYFDGNYPAGGARLFADVLPIEHVLLALGGALIAARAGKLASFARRSPAWIVGLSLAGFALRGGFDHAQLRDRDGGAPLFSGADLRARGVTSALVFTDSDAAFNLAFDPGARAAIDSGARAAIDSGAHAGGDLGARAAIDSGPRAPSGIDVVRFKGDALDALAWRERGSPPAFRARFEVAPGELVGRTVIEPYAPALTSPAAIDGGSLWPPRAQDGGAYALPVFASGSCASAARLLRLYRGPTPGGSVRLGAPAKLVAGATLELGFLLAAPPSPLSEPAFADVSIIADGVSLARVSLAIASGTAPMCAPAVHAAVPAGARSVAILLTPRWSGSADPDLQPLIALDRVLVTPSSRRAPASTLPSPANSD